MRKEEKSRREKILRTLFLEQGGLVIHSGSVKEVCGSFLFVGKSKTGKSTITRKLDSIITGINDDMNILKFKKEGIEVSSFFLRSENPGFHYLINEEAKGILKAVLFPKMEFIKDSHIEKIDDRGHIWKTLLTCVAPPLKGEDELFPNYLSMLEKLMDSVPFFNIHHNLNDSPEFIAELLRGIK